MNKQQLDDLMRYIQASIQLERASLNCDRITEGEMMDAVTLYSDKLRDSVKMTRNVTEIKTVDRPHTVALITALENAVEEVAMGNLTPMEVYACLHMVAAKYLPRD